MAHVVHSLIEGSDMTMCEAKLFNSTGTIITRLSGPITLTEVVFNNK